MQISGRGDSEGCVFVCVYLYMLKQVHVSKDMCAYITSCSHRRMMWTNGEILEHFLQTNLQRNELVSVDCGGCC